MNPKKIFLAIIIIFFLISSAAVAKENDKKVYLIIANRLSLNDLEYMKNYNELINTGGFGLLNTRGLHGYKGPESHLTINTSKKAFADYLSSTFHNATEKYLSIYKRRTGEKVTQGIINLEINYLKKINENNKYSPLIGALGDNLHRFGFKTAVLGNSDTADDFIRQNCLIAMDSKGYIDYGDVDNILIKNYEYPFGLKTNYKKIYNQLNKFKDRASFFVIETGDLDRLYFYSEKLSDSSYNYMRRKILKDIDLFIGNIYKELNNNSLLIIISPNGGDIRYKENSKLTPLIVYGEDIKKGILTSNTTRREGIVSNYDIAPTITDYLEIDSIGFSGNRIKVIDNKENKSLITDMYKKTNNISNLRKNTLYTYALITALIILLVTIKIIFNKILKFDLRILKLLLIKILIIPLVLMVIPSFKNGITVFLLLVFYGGLVYLILKRKDILSIILILIVTYLIIIIDVVNNSKLIKYSLLGYDPIIGARYFGIGNEMLGVLLASVMLLLGFLYKNNLVTYLILIFTIFIVGNPNLGANVGGTLALLTSSFYFFFKGTKGKLNAKNNLILITLFFIFLVLIGFMDAFFNNTPSHLGKMFLNIYNNGISIFINIIFRKVLMNIKLIGVTIWTKILYVNIICIMLLVTLFEDRIKYVVNKKKSIYIGIISVFIGSITGLIVNDSGIILSSIATIFNTIIFLFTIMDFKSVVRK
ncbi:MAG: hypothetical protein FH753_07600 [Firmicutes bacterium]|nr:hypothetical protein [Bacillota bacterium]